MAPQSVLSAAAAEVQNLQEWAADADDIFDWSDGVYLLTMCCACNDEISVP